MTSLVSGIGFDELPERSHRSFDLMAFDRPDGSPCSIPVHVLTGSGRRPRIVAIAGIHGDEPDGMLALIEATREVPIQALKGQLVLVPVAHPPAFAAGTRRSPIDGLDLNRIFPGVPTGAPTERLAHRLFTQVVKSADFLFTLHSWYATGTVLPFVEVLDGNSDVARQSLAAAKASGFERIRLTTWPQGLLVLTANEAGIPGMEAEIGDSGASRPANQKLYLSHLYGLMHHLGMLGPSEPARGGDLYRGQHVRADSAGMLHMRVALGDSVKAGQIVAEVTDLHGRTTGSTKSPVSGTMISRRSYASVMVGDIIATIFSPAST